MIDRNKLIGAYMKRYIIFGCVADQLIEVESSFYGEAVKLASTVADCGFKPRIWDNYSRRFIKYLIG